MDTRRLLGLLALLSFGCNNDALYTYCTESEQCGARTYRSDDVEITVSLACIEVAVSLPDETTFGRFCTLPCEFDDDCESKIGLPLGRCVRWDGDDASFCYARCGSDADCYPSSSCEAVVVKGFSERLCLPRRS